MSHFRLHLRTGEPGGSATLLFRAPTLAAAAQFYRDYEPFPGWAKIGFSFNGRYVSPQGAYLMAPPPRRPRPVHIPVWSAWTRNLAPEGVQHGT